MSWWGSKQVGKVPRLTDSEQLQLALDLMNWMRQGVNVWQGLNMVLVSSRELGDAKLETASRFLLAELSEGKSLGQAFHGWANPELVVILDSGVKADNLIGAIQELERNVQLKRKLLQAIVRQLIYPISLFATSLVALWFVGTQILPRLLDGYGQAEMLPVAVAVSEMANLIQLLFVPCILLLVSLIIWVLSNRKVYTSTFHRLVSTTVFYQVYRLFCAVSVLNQLSLMAKYSRSLARSCVILKNHAQGLVKHHYQVMLEHYANGYTELSDVMNSGLLESSSLMRLRMSSGRQSERSQQIYELAINLSRKAESITRRRLKVVVWSLYSISFLLVVATVVATAQTVFYMLEQWS
ncbi:MULTISPECIES: type II secretion system F family protein [Gammaproteobacteria]|uniref:type II secretion system F family protein n=1 Tax=Gammaproteobacteria TaxID=1236 RepID=UPI000DD045F5|nr:MULTISPECIES: type II secretion system F family protein [Gammaproteobacteria]RTE86877.1 hypothetical protein DQX04_00335 [Aliidiomarina sp. B3213]TCZ93334.1 hypothetical protein EYQ95_04965 [Lysobacter sp. N42]